MVKEPPFIKSCIRPWYTHEIRKWQEAGVLFHIHFYVPECHPETGETFLEREDEAHVFKVFASVHCNLCESMCVHVHNVCVCVCVSLCVHTQHGIMYLFYFDAENCYQYA